MDVDIALIRRLETLTGLACDDLERECLRRDLDLMLDHVGRLEDFVAGGEATIGGSHLPHRLRTDTPRPSLTTAEALDSTGAVGDGCFSCPPIRDEG